MRPCRLGLAPPAPPAARPVPPSLEVRQRPEDRQPHLPRHLVGITHPRVRPIEQDRSHDGQTEASDQGHQHEARRGVLHRPLRRDGGVEDPDVRYGAGVREARLLVPLLQVGIHVFGERHRAPQPRLLHRAGRDLAQGAGASVDPPAELRLPRRELARERSRDRGDRVPRQRRDLGQEALHLRVGVRVLVPESAQVGLFRDQLLQGRREIGTLLHGGDRFERGGGHPRVGGLHDRLLQRFPIASHLVALELQVEEAHQYGVPVRRRDGPTRRRSVGRQRDRPHAEALQGRLGGAQVLPRRLELLVENLRQLDHLLALQLRRHLHVTLRHGVHDGRHPRRVRAAQLEPEKIPVGVGTNVEPLIQAARAVPEGGQRELHAAPGLERGPRAGRPQEPLTPADRVSEQPSLELGPVVGGERVALCRGIDGELVATRPILAGHVQRGQHGAVRRPPRREEQALIAHHLVEHRVRPEQIHPGFGIEQMPRADRAAIRGAPVGLIDPDGRLRQVLRSDKPGSRDPARTAQERDRENQPFEPLDGTQHTAPVDSDLRLDEMGLHESQRGRVCRRRRTRGPWEGDEGGPLVAKRHAVSLPQVEER